MASFCLDDVVKTPMLAFAPMLDEGDHSAAQHIAFIEATLELYSKTLDAITFVIGDNCSVNQRMAGLLNVPLVGCVSHRFNLAVQRMMEEHKNLLDRIHCVMLRARSVKNRSALRLLTPLAPQLRNDTRWSSTYAIVASFFEIKDHLAAITDLRVIFPAPVEIDAMHSLRAVLDVMQGFTLAFEREDLTLSEARVLMDALCDKFPSMSHHLSPRAAIVKHPYFETTVIKVIDGREIRVHGCMESVVGNELRQRLSSEAQVTMH
ncbi:hypothetical protein DYB38_014064 [Aphanomyces astaci]|uniref:Uncharacterized protein n=1 Tax=Aphanomyces astaci TaxID=112090 RepID=A0A397DC35_APHAT|nr:hypothetical protein DYB38_014064 [Aphanomyces astaci]